MNNIVKWNCPGNDNRDLPKEIIEQEFRVLEDSKFLADIMKSEYLQGKELRLPLVKNMVAAVCGAGIKRKNNAWICGDYCCKNLDDIESIDFNLFHYPEMQAILECMEICNAMDGTLPIELEIDAPFSVLGALINPACLFTAARKESDRLKEIIKKITKCELEYIEAMVDRGCKVISLTDSIGELELVGKKFYMEFSGDAVMSLINGCDEFLDKSLLHLCGRTSCSLAQAGLIEIQNMEMKAADYTEALFKASSDSQIRVVGNRCIHNKNYNGELFTVKLLNSHI